jgi:hypothetical protein
LFGIILLRFTHVVLVDSIWKMLTCKDVEEGISFVLPKVSSWDLVVAHRFNLLRSWDGSHFGDLGKP